MRLLYVSQLALTIALTIFSIWLFYQIKKTQDTLQTINERTTTLNNRQIKQNLMIATNCVVLEGVVKKLIKDDESFQREVDESYKNVKNKISEVRKALKSNE